MPVASDQILDELDAALMAVRNLMLRPGYKQRVLATLGEPVDFPTLRAVRAVELLRDQGPGVGSVADLLGLDPSTASRVVDRAVTAGYLARHPQADDRRRHRLELTDAGERLLARANAARRDVLGELTAGWDEAELDQLADLLQRLRGDLDRLEQP